MALILVWGQCTIGYYVWASQLYLGTLSLDTPMMPQQFKVQTEMSTPPAICRYISGTAHSYWLQV